jgi:hypothetical protein
VTGAAGVVGGIVGSSLPGHHSFAMGALAAAAVALPARLIESWYKRRHRREEEQLFVLPSDQRVTTITEAR